MPIIPTTVPANHNGNSSLFQKMQQYLYKPPNEYGHLGPQDFIVPHARTRHDFYNAYYALLPYIVYADPATNPFVIPEGGAGAFGPAIRPTGR